MLKKLYDVVNLTGLVCNISQIKIVKTNQKTICLRKVTLKVNSDDISMLVFTELVEKGKEIYINPLSANSNCQQII